MKINRSIQKLLYALVIPAVILSCDGDDDEATATVDFAGVGTGYNEADGDMTITIPFRRADASMSQSDLEIIGDATEGEDYEIVSVNQEGIQISLKDDSEPEHVVETIRIRIPGSNGNAIHTVTLANDDPGFVDIDLVWPGNPDMDLILVYAPTVDDEFEVHSFSDPGHLSLDWTDADGIYGLSYNYYGGTVEPLDFTVTFTPTNMTLEGGSDPLVYEATYMLVNKDPNAFQIEQTFVKDGLALKDFSEIEVPAEGSRKKELIIKMRKAIADYKAGK
jgi:hypothetical protein